MQVVTVADWEADRYNLFARERPVQHHLRIRAASNRGVDHEAHRRWDMMQQQPVQGQSTTDLPRANARPARTATLTIR